MKIDQTRLKEFWRNPEKYRICYECNVVPALTPYGLARGDVYHTVLDLHARGWESEKIKDCIFGKIPDNRGRIIKHTPIAIKNGWEMARAYIEVAPRYKILGTECEFDVPIEGSPHSMVGRLDQLVEQEYEEWLLEFKTANPRARFDSKVTDWMTDVQADFEIIGARSLGFNPAGVKVQYVIESTPPNVWQEIEVTRSESRLQRTKLVVHQTCETIEMFRATFGIETPWPHLSQWPCIGECEKCDYSHICGRSGPLIPENLQGFVRREEHLEILQ